MTRLGQLNQSKSFKTSSSIPASLPHLKENDFIPAGAKNGQFCERGDVYWRRDARYSNHRTFKCTRAQIRPYVRTFGYLPWPFIFGPEHRFEWEDVRNFIGRHKKHQSKIQKVLWQITSKICVVRASEEPSKTFFLGRFWSKLAVEPLLESGQTTMNTFPLAKIAAALTKQWGYPKIMQCWGWGEVAEDFEGPWWLKISRYS